MRALAKQSGPPSEGSTCSEREKTSTGIQIRNVHDGEHHHHHHQMQTSTCEAVDPLIKFLFVICLGPPSPPAVSGSRGLCNYAGPFLQSDSCVKEAVDEMS